jgi:hypothetical protein
MTMRISPARSADSYCRRAANPTSNVGIGRGPQYPGVAVVLKPPTERREQRASDDTNPALGFVNQLVAI